MPTKQKTLVISVSAGTGCYRHIKISDHATLEELSSKILDAFEFIEDHAHAFFMDNRAWSDTDSYYMAMEDEEDDERHTCDFTLRKAGLKPGKKFVYVFDFGDDWRFHCRVLQILDEQTDEPEVIRTKGEPPDQFSFDDDWDEDEENDDYD
ncbi:MAG: Plasmid pRiA4b ORF-3-like protein [Firmicutes bacterium ADurb.Bin182]|nr:MAG: Plasmid pRiA4b ORF-3-like protein [Firmicutes bacterium ADurb.Bin182]